MKILFLVMMIVSGSHLSAQTDGIQQKPLKSDFGGFLNLGLGQGNLGFSATSSLQCNYKFLNVMIRASSFDKASSKSFSWPDDGTYEVGILYGCSYAFSNSHVNMIQVKACIGKATHVTHGNQLADGYEFSNLFGENYEEIEHSFVGLAYNIQFIHAPTDNFGVGVQFFGNYNKQFPIYACAVTLSICKFN